MWSKFVNTFKELHWWPPSFLLGRQLCVAVCAFALGVLLAHVFGLPALPLLVLAVLAVFTALAALLLRRGWAAWLVLVCLLLAGGFTAAAAERAVQSFPAAGGEQVVLVGRALRDSDYRETTAGGGAPLPALVAGRRGQRRTLAGPRLSLL